MPPRVFPFFCRLSPFLSQSVELTRAGSHMCVFTKHLSNFQYTTIHSINRAQRDSQAVKFFAFCLIGFYLNLFTSRYSIYFYAPPPFISSAEAVSKQKKWANAAFSALSTEI